MWRSEISNWMVTVVIVLSVSTTSAGDGSIPKCCKLNQWIVSDDGPWFCQNSTRVIMDEGPTSDETSTECKAPYNSKMHLFRIQDDTFLPREVLTTVSKCCPLNFFYDHVHHSCVSVPDRPVNLTESFMNIGLPHCDVISDFGFESAGDFDIQNGTLSVKSAGEVFPEGEFCVDENVNWGYSARVCRNIGVCKKMRCIRKCCPDGQSFVNGSFCRDTFEYGLRFDNLTDFVGDTSDDFAIIHGYPPSGVHVLSQPINLSLDRKGIFHNFMTKEEYRPEYQPYCIEHATKNNRTYGHIYFGHLVGSGPPLATKYSLNRAAMILSGIFLVLTMVFYAFTKEIRKVFAKAMVSFCLSLLALYIILVYYTFTSNLHYKSNKVTCKAIGFLTIYLTFCCFVWLQIISFDIYWTFGYTKNFSSGNDKKRKAFRRFILYSLYGWGVPMAITAVSVFFHYINVLPGPIEIRMGDTKCAIETSAGNYAEILFRTVPLTVIQMTIIFLFVRTVSYCLKVKNDIKRMNETATNIKKKKKFFARRERFQLVLKLSLSMGVFYVFEVVSSFRDFSTNTITSTIEIIWDFINCLQGLYIFLIFVCKMKNIRKCKKSSALEKIRKISLSSTRTTTISSGHKKISEEEPKKMEAASRL